MVLYAYARLVRGQWVVSWCPFCGKRHWHGAGDPKDPPQLGLGSRQPHCVRQRPHSVYYLTDDPVLQGRRYREDDFERMENS